jgi:hypothetical protein
VDDEDVPGGALRPAVGHVSMDGYEGATYTLGLSP